MRLHAAVSASAVATAAILTVGFGFCLAVNLPGHLSYDSVIQLLEGRTGQYAGWHPPFMSWLLGIADTLHRGTALFVAANVTLFFAGLLSLLWLVKKPSWLAAVVAALCLLSPQVLLYQGIVWKDILLANEAIAAFVCLALAAALWTHSAQDPSLKSAAQISALPQGEGRSARIMRWVLIAAALILFVFAALTRQNGILLLPFGALALGWIAARHTTQVWYSGLSYSLAFLIAGIALFTAGNVALGTRLVRESGEIRQLYLLQTYDVIGAMAMQPGFEAAKMRRNNPAFETELRTDGVRLYNPERNDPLAASARLQDMIANAPYAREMTANAWRDLIFHHPLLYLRVRTDVFRWVFLTPDLKMCLPVFAGVSGPAPEMSELGLAERDDARDEALTAYAGAFIGTPVLSHAAFAFLALIEIVLLFRRRRDADIAMGAMLVGALAFTASFFVIAIACDYRYLYFPDLAALTGLFYLSLDPRSLLRAGLRERNGSRGAAETRSL